MEKAHSTCYKDFTEDCSKLVHHKLDLDWDSTLKCVNGTFSDPTDICKGDNSVLKLDRTHWKRHSPHFLPAVIINGVPYRGNLDPDDVFIAICAGYKHKPSMCRTHSRLERIEKPAVTMITMLFVIFFIIFINTCLFLLCKSRIQHLMNGRLEQRVEQVVNNYGPVQSKPYEK